MPVCPGDLIFSYFSNYQEIINLKKFVMKHINLSCADFNLDIRQCSKKDGSIVYCGFYCDNNAPLDKREFECFCYETLQEAFEHFCQFLEKGVNYEV